jgi:Abnormal spindle-like microcephaly-assoc'd, ASPM-SPD-2-Hydin
VDEGNNAISMFYGPLTTVNATIQKGATGYNVPLGNYSPTTGSPAVNWISANSTTLPTTTEPSLKFDFYGNPRPDTSNTSQFDVGAVEVPANGGTILPNAVVRPAAALFGTVPVGGASTQPVTVSNPGTAPLVINGLSVGGAGANANQFTVSNGNCPIGGAGLAAGASCTANVTFHPTAAGQKNSTLSVTVDAH